MTKLAMRLNPMYPVNYLFGLGHAYMLAGRYEEAIATLNRVILRNPHFHPAHIYLAITFGELGRMEEAQAEAEKFMKMTFPMSWGDWKQRLPYKDETVVEHFFDVLRKAEIKPW